ncbi:MAG TPA: hypothetical protein VGB14_10590 [Acidimicrobiales bacterium]|jgi:hypothetical protein
MAVLGGAPGYATVACDTKRHRWRRLADSPVAAAEPAAVAWTGTDLVVVRGFEAISGDPATDTAALRPADGT